MIRVLIVDDHAVVRRGLEQLIGTADDIEVVATAGDGVDAVALAAIHRPDVIMMDLSMPNMDGIEATRRIVASGLPAQIVILTSFAEQRKVVDAIAAGACGYLLKDSDPDALAGAVRAAAAGGAPLDPKAARHLIDAQRAPMPVLAAVLSAREEEVLRLVSEGLANKQIARRLSIAERTVKAHLTAIFQRVGVTDRTQAALWARDHLLSLN
ncbi:MAG: response regulator transcription factor [Ilumatobacteraceae bacterium]